MQDYHEYLDEILISEEEIPRTIKRDGYFVIQPVLPALRKETVKPVLTKELSSADHCMSRSQMEKFLKDGGYL